MRARAALAATCSGLALALVASSAPAFCRITTTQTKVDGPDLTACYDTTHPPVWWRTSCVGLSVQATGSKYAPYSVIDDILFHAVIPNWMSAVCPGGGNPSLAIVDLGKVDCDTHQNNLYGPNANAVLFHDDVWPYEESAGCSPGRCCDATVALTTVTFHPETGELWDADIEVNTACHPISTSLPVPPDRYDLQSILQHETGHFLGLAHPPDPQAIMFYLYQPGNDGKRALNVDDVRGACTIYPPTGARSVAASVAEKGFVAGGACDPTPRNGFSSACVADAGNQPPEAQPPAFTCSASHRAPSPWVQAWFTLILGVLGLARRRRRLRAPSALLSWRR
jgi:hypothetical protein